MHRPSPSNPRGHRAIVSGLMPWARMRFKGQLVWVNVGDDGRPILDGDGRAEMKYRETDQKTYRPGPSNLIPVDSNVGDPADTPSRTRAPASSARRSPRAGAADGPVVTTPSPRGTKVSPTDPETVHVWTDGACTGNPGPMGIGVVVLHGKQRVELGEFLGDGTNNIAELTAIERGLDLVAEAFPSTQPPLRIYTDSQYSIGVLGLGWKAKANQELVGRLRQRLGTVGRFEFVKVAGHAGVPENERCDELAREGILHGRR